MAARLSRSSRVELNWMEPQLANSGLRAGTVPASDALTGSRDPHSFVYEKIRKFRKVPKYEKYEREKYEKIREKYENKVGWFNTVNYFLLRA